MLSLPGISPGPSHRIWITPSPRIEAAGAAMSSLGPIAASRSTGGVQDPSDILGANLFLWYKASLGITLNGGDVSAWANQGNGGSVNPAQATPANQPLFVASAQNSKPCVRFTVGNGDMLSVSSGGPSQTSNHSIFVVAKWNTLPGAFRGLFGIGDDSKSSGIGGTNANVAWYGGDDLTTPVGAALSTTGVHRFGKTVSSGTTQGYRNGATDGSTATHTYGASTGVTIGSYKVPPNTNNADCDIYEIVVADVAMSAGQISDLDTYFVSEYAL